MLGLAVELLLIIGHGLVHGISQFQALVELEASALGVAEANETGAASVVCMRQRAPVGRVVKFRSEKLLVEHERLHVDLMPFLIAMSQHQIVAEIAFCKRQFSPGFHTPTPARIDRFELLDVIGM